jgi:transposase
MIRKQSRYRLGKDRAQQLYQAAQESVGIREGVESIVFEIQDILKMIEDINAFIDDVEQKMSKSLQEIPYSKMILSLPGIGKITVAGLIGEVGDFRKFSTIAEVQKLAGLNLYEVSSGNHKGQRRISKRGRGLMRKLMYFAALNAVRKGGILHNKYQSLVDRGMLKMKALVAIARKLLGIIYALVRKHQMYILNYKNSSLVTA